MADLVVAGFTGTSLVVVSCFLDPCWWKYFQFFFRVFFIFSNSQVRSPSSPNPGVSISLEVKPAALNGVLISSSQFTLRFFLGVKYMILKLCFLQLGDGGASSEKRGSSAALRPPATQASQVALYKAILIRICFNNLFVSNQVVNIQGRCKTQGAGSGEQ